MTDRWWARRESSLAALGRVDSSDAVQGVGTAVLAYHGLSKAVLEPLAHMTLMDVSAVNKALHGLDIAPVAKALGSATQGEMGGASGRYGQLLADDIHATAIESTGRLITSLVQSGMAWPVAIDRASKVHGIPTDRLGKAGPALRAPVMQPLAADDIADRALMEYASHVGRREATTTAVSKAGAGRQRFREDEVVRDEDGRFADEGEKKKNSLVELSGDSLERAMLRQRRRNRKKRVAGLRESRKEAKAESSSGKVTLAGMAAAERQSAKARNSEREASAAAGGSGAAEKRRAGEDDTAGVSAAAKAEAAAKMRADAMRSLKEKVLADLKAKLLSELRNRKPATEDTEFGSLMDNPVKPRMDGLYPGWVGGSLSQQKFLILDVHLAKEAVRQGGFNYGAMSAQDNFYNFNGRNEPMTRDQLRSAIRELSFEPGSPEDPGKSVLDDLAIVVFDGDVAYGEDFTGGFSEALADAGTYEVARGAQGAPALDYEDTYDLKLMGFEDPGSKTSQLVSTPLPHFTVTLANAKAFDRVDGIVTDYGKAWQESSVMRDEDGRFAEEIGSALTPEEIAARKALRMKRKARKARVANIRSQREANKPASVSVTLAGIAAAERARAKEERSAAAADGTAARVSVSGDSNAADRKAATDDLRKKVVADLKARTIRDLKAKLVAQSAVKMEEKALADEAIRADHHEDWKFLDALTFDRDQAHGSFIDMFGMDPYNGSRKMNGRSLHGDSEHEDMLDYARSRIRPAGVVVESMHTNPPIDALNDAVPAWGVDAHTEVHQHAFDAFASAAAWCELENEERPWRDRTWMPTVKFDEHSGMYEPWMQQAFKVNEHVVVLGSKEEWNLVMNGGDVELVPLAGFDKNKDEPGQGSFDTLFTSVTDDPASGSYSASSGRSDYYIRAFRIKT